MEKAEKDPIKEPFTIPKLKFVCPEGYVYYEGKWFVGECREPEKKDCSKCDFPGCDFLH